MHPLRVYNLPPQPVLAVLSVLLSDTLQSHQSKSSFMQDRDSSGVCDLNV